MSQTTLPAHGQPWPNLNALYAGIIAKPDGTAWALLRPTDVPALPDQPWGEYGKVIDGADDPFDGYANTLAMAAAGNKLAKAVRDLPGDCYLPSRMEALVLFATLREQIGSGWAWTSTQYSAGIAWFQHFGYGGQLIGNEAAELRAVPVRRLVLRSFDASLEGCADHTEVPACA